MRKIVAGLFLSLDGVMEAPEVWTKPYMNEEIGREVGAEMAASDAMLLGRVTYETFAAAFTGDKADDPIADRMNGTPKYVVSTTLRRAEWQNTTLVEGDLATELTKLKDQPGKDIAISGSPTLVRALLREGLLDELRLMIFPVVVGSGRRFFDKGFDRTPLEVVSSRALSTGVLVVRYRPAGDGPA
jgi:dihydrofolate reductase